LRDGLAGHPGRMDSVEYSPGRRADLYGDDARVLMWHGAQTDARASMRRLAEAVAAHGLGVIVPDWNSQADDRGREDLLRSFAFARERSSDPDGLVLVGWSLGGLAAAGLTLRTGRLGVRLAHTVCLAGAFMVADPISGEPLPADLTGLHDRPPFALLHGVSDDVIPIAVSREFAETLRQAGWPAEIAELDADHASIAGATYDAENGRYLAGSDPKTLAVAADVANRIATAARN
jgi:pimeloyl-ACP methyl ester carboxylesterase